MRSLADIQEQFLEQFLTGKDTTFSLFKSHGAIDIAGRFAVHRQTIFENLVSSLQITFPGIWKLLGDECAEGVAFAYNHEASNLPVICTFEEFGKNFPAFLAEFPSTNSLKYLPDFATLEWLRSRSYNAERGSDNRHNLLASISPELIESVSLKFNPSVFFMRSEFSLEQIQELLDNPDSGPITLANGVSHVIICKVDGEIITLWLQRQVWLFLNAINEGQTLGSALDIFLQYGREEEVPELFQLIARYKLIADVETKQVAEL